MRFAMKFLVLLIAQPTGLLIAQVPPVDRSPIDLALSPNGRWCVTANRTSATVSLIDVQSRAVVDEKPVAERPEFVVFSPDGQAVVVSCSYGGTVEHFRLSDRRLEHVRSLHVGYLPQGLAFSPDGAWLFVARLADGTVAVVNWPAGQIIQTIPVGGWPRTMTLVSDGRRLVVAANADRRITVVDTVERRIVFSTQITGLNFGHLAASRDGRSVYLPWTVYRRTPITPANIRLGWVLGSRIGRVDVADKNVPEPMPLDVPGKAVADPFGIALSRDERWLVVAAGGTHELIVLRRDDLPLGDPTSGNHLPAALRSDTERFCRIDLGGRPMAVQIGPDDRLAWVANYLRNCVQVVDIHERKLVDEIRLGGPDEPSLARRGEMLFYDARLSMDQWYSCHTCHFEGGTNAEPIDTHNDGTTNTYKTVLPLYHVRHTGPWTWHGWQDDLSAALVKSLTSTMQGPQPTNQELEALLAFLDQLSAPPSPFAGDSQLADRIERGRQLFFGSRAGCSTCHRPPYFTDGKLHDVGLGSARDAYPSFNTPTLRAVFLRPRLLHDGRARSLEEVLSGPHAPQQVAGEALSPEELADLVAFLKTL
ncbi:MAG: hypothetical protein KatS3mg110_3983 [Pirellulaceae bacterium]|nr:MAG: hypothetical protein KatS3mg110_3983 [Pirellulaceae bacterium]